MTPIRANIVGPPYSTTTISVSIAPAIRRRPISSWQAGDVITGIAQRDEGSSVWQRYRIIELALPAAFFSHDLIALIRRSGP